MAIRSLLKLLNSSIVMQKQSYMNQQCDFIPIKLYGHWILNLIFMYHKLLCFDFVQPFKNVKIILS